MDTKSCEIVLGPVIFGKVVDYCRTHKVDVPANSHCSGWLKEIENTKTTEENKSPKIGRSPGASIDSIGLTFTSSKVQLSFTMFHEARDNHVFAFGREPNMFLVHPGDWSRFQSLFFENPNKQGVCANTFNGISVDLDRNIPKGTIQCR